MIRRQLAIDELLKFRDPREVPAYSIPEAAHYLSMPAATLRAWVLGADYTSPDGSKRRFRKVIELPVKDSPLLSFFNLTEAHILRALRTQHGVGLPQIRKALDFVKKQIHCKRPLIQQAFKTDGVHLFVDHLGQLLDATANGQVVMRGVIDAHLDRLEWEDDVVARLYPFTRENLCDAPKSVFIDPRFSFGRPILRESRVATAIVAERYKAGESIEDIAHDYGCSRLEIEEGVRCELRLQTAA